MRNVTTRIITPEDSEIKKARDLYYSAFPEEERVDDAHMLALMQTGRAKLLAIDAWEGEESLCAGYAYLIIGESGTGYLLFFAIYDEMRGKGIGGGFLNWLAEAALCRQVVLDIEDPRDENAPNKEERIGRKRFYLERGFYETSQHIIYEGQIFEVLCTAPQFNIDGYTEIIEEMGKLGSIIKLMS